MGVSNSLNPDQARKTSCLIWVQTVCKGYQQTTLVVKELSFLQKVIEQIKSSRKINWEIIYDLQSIQDFN